MGVFFRRAYWRHLHLSAGTAYRPVRELTFAMDHAVWGLRPWGFHLTNLLLHLAGGALVGVIGARLIGRRVGWLGALLFLVHPAGVESFAWVKNRGELLGLALFGAAWLSFMRAIGLGRWRKGDSGRIVSYVTALAAFVMAVLSKASSAALCPLFSCTALLAHDRRARREAMLRSVPFWIVLAGTQWFRGTVGGEPTGSADLPFRETANLIGTTVSTYARLIVFPFHCRPLYDVRNLTGAWAGAMGLGLLCLAIGSLGWAAVRRCRCSILWGWALLALAPVSNIVTLTDRPIAEQRLYGMLGPACLLAAAGLCGLPIRRLTRARRRPLLWTALGIAAVFVARAGDSVWAWGSNRTLWTSATKAAPNVAKCHFNLATAYSNAGETAKATWALRRAIQHNPLYGKAYRRLAELAYRAKDFERAEAYLASAMKLLSKDADLWNLTGLLMVERGRMEEAKGCFRAALMARPDFLPAWQNLGLVHERLGAAREAIHAYLNALGMDDKRDARLHCAVGDLYMRLNQPESALWHYREAARADASYVPAKRGRDEAQRRTQTEASAK